MGNIISPEVQLAARRVKLLLMDCDGVLTDGRLYFSARGEEMKVFHVRDGQGLVLWHAAGFKSGIISGRNGGEIIRARAEEVGVEFVYAGSADKVKDFLKIIEAAGVAPEETAYVGDDVGDIPLLKIVGLPIAVADSAEEVLPFAAFVTSKSGGRGAIREVTDLLLKAKADAAG